MAAICNRCNKILGMLDKRYPTQDGLICGNCLSELGYDIYYGSTSTALYVKDKNFSQIEKAAQRGREIRKIMPSFNPTYKASEAAQFDDTNRRMLLAERVEMLEPYLYALYSYDQLIGCEIIENGNVSTVGAVDGAIVGGFLFGAAGAVVGGAVGGAKECSQLEIKLTLKESPDPAFYIRLIEDWNKTVIGSSEYNKKTKIAQDIIAKLQVILNENQAMKKSPAMSVGVGKTDTADPSAQVSSININPNSVEPTITRIELFLEDQEWERAKAYAEAALDYFPTDYRLYLALLCVDMKVTAPEKLKDCVDSFKENPNYKKAIRFADNATGKSIEKLSAAVDENAMQEQQYSSALEALRNQDYDLAYSLFESMSGYKDSDDQLIVCANKMSEQKVQEEQAQELQDQLSQESETVFELLKRRTALVQELNSVTGDGSSAQSEIQTIEKQLLNHIGKYDNRNGFAFDGFKAFKVEKLSWGLVEQFDFCNSWDIIAREKQYVLLLSRYCQKGKPYTATRFYHAKEPYSWHTSSMRNYLVLGEEDVKKPFIEAFDVETRRLFESPQRVYNNNSFPEDVIYVLSEEEIVNYLPNNAERILLEKSDSSQPLPWVVRTDSTTNYVRFVNEHGDFASGKVRTLMNGTFKDLTLRPAMWLDLSRIPKMLESKIEKELETHKRKSALGDTFIEENDSSYTHITMDGYSFCVPVDCIEGQPSADNGRLYCLVKKMHLFRIERVKEEDKSHQSQMERDMAAGFVLLQGETIPLNNRAEVSIALIERDSSKQVRGCYKDLMAGIEFKEQWLCNDLELALHVYEELRKAMCNNRKIEE